MFMPLCGIGLAAGICSAAEAQRISPPPAGYVATPAAAPGAIDPATIPLPDLAFQPTREIEDGYGKHHFFHREETDFATAHADILECDGYSRGFTHTAAGGDVPYPYAGTVAGAVGGMIGAAVSDAIFGADERRRLRRVNMRTCMEFKGYRAYGLPERLWDQFNFTEGLRTLDPTERARMIRVQARVASGPRPAVGEMTQ
jgi:hypothetical protein